MKKEGIHIQTNSLFSTSIPHFEKNPLMLIGETLITFQGKKNLAL